MSENEKIATYVILSFALGVIAGLLLSKIRL